jgi:hypothetical protein
VITRCIVADAEDPADFLVAAISASANPPATQIEIRLGSPDIGNRALPFAANLEVYPLPSNFPIVQMNHIRNGGRSVPVSIGSLSPVPE